MNAKITVCDEYSGLASLLANLIAKYADELNLEDDTESNQSPAAITIIDRKSHPIAPQGSLSQASLLFLLATAQIA